MDLLTLLPYLESYDRRTVATKTETNDAIAYTGDINTVTINEDVYTNIQQICLLHTYDNTLYLYVNHTTRRTRNKYSLTDINTIEIT